MDGWDYHRYVSLKRVRYAAAPAALAACSAATTVAAGFNDMPNALQVEMMLLAVCSAAWTAAVGSTLGIKKNNMAIRHMAENLLP